MLRISLGILFAIAHIFVGGASWADDIAGPPDKPPRSPYSQLLDRFKVEHAALLEEFPKAARQGNSELQARSKALRLRYTGEFFRHAQSVSDDAADVWVGCLIWIVQDGVAGPDYDAMIDLACERAQRIEFEGYLTMQFFMASLARKGNSARVEPMLRTLADKGQNFGVRGAALYALGWRLKRDAEAASDLEKLKEAEKVLNRVLKEAADIHTYEGRNGDNAQEQLAELHGPFAIGRPAAELKGKLLGGEEFDLASLRGQVTLVSFSGHWCGPCCALHPAEQKLLETFGESGFTLVEINSDEDSAGVAEKMTKDGLTWTCVTDGSSDGPLSTQWEISSWPTFFLLDREHRIRFKAEGPSAERLEKWVQQVVSETPAPAAK